MKTKKGRIKQRSYGFDSRSERLHRRALECKVRVLREILSTGFGENILMEIRYFQGETLSHEENTQIK